MLRIGDNIFSDEILEKKFRCDLSACSGNCCHYGDSGAPLTEEEAGILKSEWPAIKPYLRAEGVAVIEKEGTSIVDFENDLVTPLISGAECAYTVMEGSIFMCGIEKAWLHRALKFRKPISCHLFPVRIKRYPGFNAVNYQELPLCSPALRRGSAEGVYLYEFLKVPLLRAFGEGAYHEMCITAKKMRKRKTRR